MTAEQILKCILNHIVLVVVIPLLAVAATAYACWNVLPKTYTAETSLYVLTQSDTDTLNYNEINLSTQLVNDYREMAESRRVTAGALEMVGISEKDFEENYSVAVDSTTTTRLIRLSVTAKNPANAANLANALAAKLSDCILAVTNVENISVIDEATPPEKASGPRSLMYTAVAGIAGLAIAVAIALMADNLNVKIKTRDDVEQMLHLPVLAQIPIDNSK